MKLQIVSSSIFSHLARFILNNLHRFSPDQLLSARQNLTDARCYLFPYDQKPALCMTLHKEETEEQKLVVVSKMHANGPGEFITFLPIAFCLF